MRAQTIFHFAEAGHESVGKAPYCIGNQQSYLELHAGTERATKKRGHAIKHCVEMARHCANSEDFPQSCDWIVAAFAQAGTEDEVVEDVATFWNDLSKRDSDSLNDAFHSPPPQIGKRNLGLTLVRCIANSKCDFSREFLGKSMKFLAEAAPDVLKDLRTDSDAPQLDFVNASHSSMLQRRSQRRELKLRP